MQRMAASHHTRHDRTLAIGLRERSVVAEWKNGCKDARGLER